MKHAILILALTATTAHAGSLADIGLSDPHVTPPPCAFGQEFGLRLPIPCATGPYHVHVGGGSTTGEKPEPKVKTPPPPPPQQCKPKGDK